jgi:hypothetical protein
MRQPNAFAPTAGEPAIASCIGTTIGREKLLVAV